MQKSAKTNRSLFMWGMRLWHFVLWPLLSPLLHLVFPLFSVRWRERIKFEQKNHSSFSPQHASFQAHFCFEVSSEGELQQILPLIMSFLQESKRVEVVFCSPSVELQVLSLAQKFPQQVRCWRLPLLNVSRKYSFLQWTTAPVLILCRYDFFPELMIAGSRAQVKFVLVSATLKNKNKLFKFYYRSLYECFDLILTPTPEDEKKLRELLLFEGSPAQHSLVPAFELRTMQIAERLRLAQQKLQQVPLLAQYQEQILASFPRRQRLVLGSFWQQEADFLQDENLCTEIQQGRWHVCLVPHDLSEGALASMLQKLQERMASFASKIPIYVLRATDTVEKAADIPWTTMRQHPGIVILWMKGVLCELYTLFGHAYVGGGFGRSIHSVLEPALAGATTYCGPKTHRSTEYDVVQFYFPQRIFVLPNSPRQLFSSILSAPDFSRNVESPADAVAVASAQALEEDTRRAFQRFRELLEC